MAELRTSLRVKAEGLAVTGKAITTFLILSYDARTEGRDGLTLLAFAGGQLAYGVILLLAYIGTWPWPNSFGIK